MKNEKEDSLVKHEWNSLKLTVSSILINKFVVGNTSHEMY